MPKEFHILNRVLPFFSLDQSAHVLLWQRELWAKRLLRDHLFSETVLRIDSRLLHNQNAGKSRPL